MKIKCRRCGKRYHIRGYGIIIPDCPFCGESFGSAIVRKPGCEKKGFLQTALPFFMSYNPDYMTR